MTDRVLKHLEIKKGTKAQFDALPVKSPDALYFLTDGETFQRKLTAGTNVTIDESTNTISTDDSNLVHKTGDEIITGAKDFKSDNAAPLTISNISSNSYRDVQFVDSTENHARVSGIRAEIAADGSRRTCLFVVDANNNNCGGIRVSTTADGSSVSAKAITPALSSNSDTIATTGWFNNKMQVVDALPASPDADTFYFIKE